MPKPSYTSISYNKTIRGDLFNTNASVTGTLHEQAQLLTFIKVKSNAHELEYGVRYSSENSNNTSQMFLSIQKTAFSFNG